MLPNFLVIGAEKSATTWIYHRLKEHPEVFMPETKEIHFFNKYDSNLNIIDNYERNGLDFYKYFFKKYNGEKAIGEVTPMYLCDESAPSRIYNSLPDIKLIAILRNPADRAYSHYQMAKAKGHVDISFEEVVKNRDVKIIQRGLYYDQLKRYYDLYPPNNILVLIMEEMFADKQQALKRIYRFLEVDEEFVPPNLERKENSFHEYRLKWIYNFSTIVVRYLRTELNLHFLVDFLKKLKVNELITKLNNKKSNYSQMDMKLRKELINYYKESNDNLSRLINKDLKNWYI